MPLLAPEGGGINTEVPNLVDPSAAFAVPAFQIDLPQISIDIPNVQIEIPEIKIEIPDIQISIPDVQISMPDTTSSFGGKSERHLLRGHVHLLTSIQECHAIICNRYT